MEPVRGGHDDSAGNARDLTMLRARLRSLWAGIARRPQVEAGISDEIQFHIEARAEHLVALGMEREEALRLARLEFGAAQKYKEEIRQARGLRLLDELRADVKYAVRTLGMNIGFSIAAVSVIGLAIGAATAMFSVVNAVLIQSLPYPAPSRLVAVSSVFQPRKDTRLVPVITLADLQEWRRRSRTIETAGAFAYTKLPVQIGQQAYSPVTAFVDSGFLPTLAEPLLMGTDFERSRTGAEAADNTAVITYPRTIIQVNLYSSAFSDGVTFVSTR